MGDYIERKRVIDLITGRYECPEICEQEISEIPAADVRPVVRGQWELKHIGAGHYWECSVCHTNPCIYVTENTHFCPNCGADMRGE